jgi:hypothetical protein
MHFGGLPSALVFHHPLIQNPFGAFSFPFTSLRLYADIVDSRWEFYPNVTQLASSVGSISVYTPSCSAISQPSPASIMSSSSSGATNSNYDVEKIATGHSSPTFTTPTAAACTPSTHGRNRSDGLAAESDLSGHTSASGAYPCTVPPLPKVKGFPLAPEPEPQPMSELGSTISVPYYRPFSLLSVASPFSPPPRVRSPIRVLIHTESHESF